MNCDTGRFENFNSGDDIKPPWREWSVDELIVVKDENTKKLVMSRLLVVIVAVGCWYIRTRLTYYLQVGLRLCRVEGTEDLY